MKHIEFSYDSVLLKGLILKREKFYLEVQLISPFEAWENYCMISGMCRMTPNHFLTEHGDITIRQLLIDSYKKSKMLHERLDRVCNLYKDYKSELTALHEIENEMKNKIKRKLEDWFFATMFTSSVTGIVASYNDRRHIFEILEIHLILIKICNK